METRDHGTHGKRRRFALFAIAGTAVLAGAAIFAGTEACTLNTNDALLDAGTFDPDATQRVSVCNACSVQQCTGQWALCLQNADCFSAYVCSRSRKAQDCICAARGDGGSGPSRAQTSYRALASCNEVSACGACNAQCKDVAAKLSCGEAGTAGTPLSLTVCASLDAGGDAALDGEVDASSDADLDAAQDDAADADDASDGGASPPDADVDALADGEAGVPALGDCSGCIAGRCGDPKKACGIGSACDVYVQCVSGCGDPSPACGATCKACFERCGTIHASGKTALASLASCASANCSTECGL